MNMLQMPKKTGCIGRTRFWACINMLMMEGVIEGEVGKHPAEMGWADTAAEIEGLKQIRREQPLLDGEALALEDGVESEENDDEEENGGRDYEAATGAAVQEQTGEEATGRAMEMEAVEAEVTVEIEAHREADWGHRRSREDEGASQPGQARMKTRADREEMEEGDWGSGERVNVECQA